MEKGFAVFAIALCLVLSGCESSARDDEIREAYNYGYNQGYEDGREKESEESHREMYRALDEVRSMVWDKETLIDEYYAGYISIEEIAESFEEIDDALYDIMEN